MNIFERYLTIWVFLCIVAGVLLGQMMPDVFQAIGHLEVAQVNLPVGLLIWVMIIPMLVKVDFGALHEVKQHVKGIGVTLFVNWFVKPFSMAFLAWFFIRGVFAQYLPTDQIDSYIAGLAVQDPRERPHDRQQAADEAHALFADKDSDFLWFNKAWLALLP